MPPEPRTLKAVRKGGRVVCAGIHMSDIRSFPYQLLWEERQLVSVANLTRQDGIDFLHLVPKMGIVTKTTSYPKRTKRSPIFTRDASKARRCLCRERGEFLAFLSRSGFNPWRSQIRAPCDCVRHCQTATGMIQLGMPISASNALTPFQVIPTPMQSMMNAERRTTTIMPVCPIRLPTRWA